MSFWLNMCPFQSIPIGVLLIIFRQTITWIITDIYSPCIFTNMWSCGSSSPWRRIHSTSFGRLRKCPLLPPRPRVPLHCVVLLEASAQTEAPPPGLSCPGGLLWHRCLWALGSQTLVDATPLMSPFWLPPRTEPAPPVSHLPSLWLLL